MGTKIIWSLILLVFSSYLVSSEKNVICYYGTWATYRLGNGRFSVENINPFLCSHLIYSFAGIDHQGSVISLDSYLDLPSGRDNFAKFNGLKQQNPKLKTLLAVGGWNEGSGKYSSMAANQNLRRNFIKSALQFTLTHGFDGCDMDWEYPNRRDTVNGAADINNFSILVKELKEEFQKYGLLVTAAVSSVAENAALSYDIGEISKHLDLIHVMTYDMYGAWDPRTGHNAPLHKGEGDENTPRESYYSVDVAIEYWLAQGAPPEKLAIGVPFYGRSFTLSDPNASGVGAPARGAGIAGPYTVTAGNVGYNELCDIIQTQHWDVHHDSLAKVPYAVQGQNWVSYDNADSITQKVKWGLQNNITNIMLWSIETDDFLGICGEDFPLLKAINKALGRNGSDEDVTEAIPTEETTKDFTQESSSRVTEGIPPEGTTKDVTEESASSSTVTTEDSILGSTYTEHPISEVSTIGPSTTQAVSTSTAGVTDPTPGPDEFCLKEGIQANPEDCTSFIMCVPNFSGHLYPVIFYCPKQLYFNSEFLICDYADTVKCRN